MLTVTGTASGGPAADPVLEVSDGAVAIEGRPVLRHIDLVVRRGEFVALMGANGSGKSTLVRAVTGLRPLAAGEVRLFGAPLTRFRQWHRVGFVPQRTGATGGVPASVREVVVSGRLGGRRPFRRLRREDRRAVAAAIDAVGLTGRERDGIATLSGGQQQRALIARALAGEPELFLLDEPAAGVDLPTQQALADLFGRLLGRGATIVLVAHELGPLAPLVDRAVVMRDGRIVHDGPPAAGEPAARPPGPEQADGRVADGPAHHHAENAHEDHAPHVGSPLDPPVVREVS